MRRFYQSAIFYVLILLVIIGVLQFIMSDSQQKTVLTWSQFSSDMQNHEVKQLVLTPDGTTLQLDGQLANGTQFTSRALYSDALVNRLSSQPNVTVAAQQQDTSWLSFLGTIVPFVLVFGILFFLFNQGQSGGNRVMNFGKSRARLYTEDKRRVTFEDVAGADEEKAELVEIVEFLKDPRKFTAVGARIPKGVLLVGPPGTGKTLLARAVAGEAGVPFFSISGSDFVEMFVGVGASRVRDLFENAKKNSPCIIFIDEIDAVGRMRGAGLGGGHDEREQTLNQLLVEMDGFGVNESIIIIAATNRADILDPALLRPGRFDRQIIVDRPDVKGREQILRVHSRNKPVSKDIRLEVLAKRTPGFTGADLENVLNEAALLTARRNKSVIEMPELDDAIDRVIAGPEKRSKVISDKERRLVAFHEGGHAVAGYYLKNGTTVHKVTIIPRGMAGGYTVSLPKEDRSFMTREDMLDRIVELLGGRVAEEIVLGEISTGASNDLERVTDIVRRMIMEFGMSSRLGPMQFGHRQGQVFLGRDIGSEQNYSDAIAYEIDKEMRTMVDECYERTRQILTEHREKLEILAQTLLEQETLDGEQVRQLMEYGRLVESNDEGPKLTINGRGSFGDSATPSLT
ncbi:MAG: ATP-dependent zinc metalloprotease FtsH [Firmicutes bacterium]|nr:ATP-dependent zinc metalloprotease FtsH [Bacillota bacterium]